MALTILFEDDSLVVCEKPVGAVSEGNGENAMPTLLKQQLGCAVFPVHRLDGAVGGVMVYAKTAQAAAKLSAQIAARQMQKEYLAVLSSVPQEASATLCDLLFFDRRRGKSFVVQRKRAGVKEASLSYELLKTAPDSEAMRALVKIELHTGRTHQIRVQFSSRKLPLLGDGKYGGSDNRCAVALWSHRLTFLHPETEKCVCFSAEPPAAFPWALF